MARLARLTLPGRVHLVTHRGNNRQPVFVDDEDRQKLLDLIGEQTAKHRVTLHGYVLLQDAMYLLLTPADEKGVPAMMQAMGRTYVRHFNARHGRSGTLWEGRYRSTLIQPERHLFACMGMMDMLPVREGLCAEPSAYAWSSHRHHIGQTPDRRLTPHPLYWSLGNTPFAREAAYAELVHRGLDAPQWRAITDAVWHGWALGDAQFVETLQRDTDRRLAPARPGRPSKRLSVN